MEQFLDLETRIYTEKLINFGISLLEAVAILVIGFWLSRLISRSLFLLMQKRDVEHSTRNFLRSFIRIILNTLVIIVAIGNVGVKVTSILAVIGGGAVGLGLGLQGSFSNFAGGIMIILTKPFKTGDLIQTEEHIGYVENIRLLNTVIRSPRNELIILPNAPLFNTALSNYSAKDAYRIDIVVGVAYRSDIHRLSPLLKEAIGRNEIFMSDRRLTVEIEQFTHDRINLTVRAYTLPTNYFDAPLILHGICKDIIEKNGFIMPVAPQDIRIVKGEC
ncbi:mechanosensitive ion channel family protein [Sinomicrobium soli]|uniref:mechanosensitive ion channel family protein n=1 Tax=Sinomicrobium sp. N-1-3-6 TaxID=2219864 RepID=UPI00137521CF|nr:mechanosensitive ion channel domain-containing protein [Sinomicrobium sp. N-1-3-6]